MAFPQDNGPIVAKVPSIIPVAWDALLRGTVMNGPVVFGEDRILEVANDVFINLFDEELDVAGQEALPTRTHRWIAKLIAIELLNAAIEIFREAPISKNTSGTAEVISWEGRLKNLQDERANLIAETRAQEAEMWELIGYRPSRPNRGPALNTIDDELLTPSPQEFPRPFVKTARS